MSEEYPPDTLPEDLERLFKRKIQETCDSLDEIRWLVWLATSLEDWEWKNARYQAGVVKKKGGHVDLLNRIDQHYRKWLEDSI